MCDNLALYHELFMYLCILTCPTSSGIEIAKKELWNKVCMNMNMEEPEKLIFLSIETATYDKYEDQIRFSLQPFWSLLVILVEQSGTNYRPFF
jgi:hypothetical protein